MGVVGAAADEIGLGLDCGDPARIDPVDEARDLGHHLGADAVARKQQDIENCHEFRPTLC